MGNTQTDSLSILNDFQNWRVKQKSQHFTKWINTLTLDQASQYSISFNDENQCYQQIRLYDYRKSSPNFVRALYLDVVQDQIVCYTSIRCKVFIQIIKYRLESLTLTQPDAYYVFFECLLGYQQLYAKFGYVEINKQMIGINLHGKIKVWLNRNYAKNNKEQDSGVIQEALCRRKKNLENAMVKKLIRIINKQTVDFQLEESQFEGNFKDVINALNEKIHKQGLILSKRILKCIEIDRSKELKQNQADNCPIRNQRKKYNFKDQQIQSITQSIKMHTENQIVLYQRTLKPNLVIMTENLKESNQPEDVMLSTKSNLTPTAKMHYFF